MKETWKGDKGMKGLEHRKQEMILHVIFDDHVLAVIQQEENHENCRCHGDLTLGICLGLVKYT
jgi:hypothetical protein